MGDIYDFILKTSDIGDARPSPEDVAELADLRDRRRGVHRGVRVEADFLVES